MPPVPNLIHPVTVQIEQIQKGSTFFDEDAREPIQEAARSAVIEVLGQPRWTSSEELSVKRGGVVEGAAGYVLFRKVDLDAASVTLQINDRFKKIGNVDTDYYVIKIQPTANYDDQGGPAMFRAWFADRLPSKLGATAA